MNGDAMIKISEPYQTRPIRFLELWQQDGWRMKVYGIAYNRPLPRPEVIDAARGVARQHFARQEDGIDNYRVGFMGIHDGRGANFLFFDYWACENELHHHVYVSPADQPEALEYVTPGGLIACVWDLRVLCFERRAWIDHVLAKPAAPDIDGYLAAQLNEDA